MQNNDAGIPGMDVMAFPWCSESRASIHSIQRVVGIYKYITGTLSGKFHRSGILYGVSRPVYVTIVIPHGETCNFQRIDSTQSGTWSGIFFV